MYWIRAHKRAVAAIVAAVAVLIFATVVYKTVTSGGYDQIQNIETKNSD